MRQIYYKVGRVLQSGPDMPVHCPQTFNQISVALRSIPVLLNQYGQPNIESKIL